jgi:hypothetical protein
LQRPLRPHELEYLFTQHTPAGRAEAALAVQPTSTYISPDLYQLEKDIHIEGFSSLDWTQESGCNSLPITLAVVELLKGRVSIGECSDDES